MRNKRRQNPQHIFDPETNLESKLCPKCKTIKELNCFYKKQTSYDKLTCWCKKCIGEKSNECKRNKKYKLPKIEIPPEKQLLLRNFSLREGNYLPEINLQDIIIPKYCPILNIPLFFSKKVSNNTPSLDRIDKSKDYSIDNLYVISLKALRQKIFLENKNKTKLLIREFINS